MAQGLAAAVFVDRDGTLISDVGYLSRKEQLEILPGVPEALRSLKEIGFKLVMITNQSGIARGLLTEADLDEIHEELCRRLSKRGVVLDGIYYCPHHPQVGGDGYRIVCDCRKPKPGMVNKAAEDLGLDLRSSYVVGDQATDMELAACIKAKGLWVCRQLAVPDLINLDYKKVADLSEAALWIAQHFQSYRTGMRG
jgi:D-glycero-D-manno-heptose 1,7-bisphosphate phosphatase